MRDVAIVGGGHNGLVCAAYLARAGFDVEVVERRDVLGGAAVTEEPWPGYRVSSASLVRGQPDAAADRARARAAPARLPHLDRLAGLLRPLPGPDGADRGDTERDSREIAQLSPADGEAYAEFDAHFDRAPRWVPDPHRGRKDGPAVLEQKGDAGRAQATARASPTIIPETVP